MLCSLSADAKSINGVFELALIDFMSVDKGQSILSEGLRFVVRAGLIYKTKTPLISRQLTKNKAFKRGSSFCSLSQPYLQNEDLIDSASDDNKQSI